MSICTAGQATAMHKVFLDTAYAIALPSKEDTYHERAMQLADQF